MYIKGAFRFNGRATRSEFWWMQLWLAVAGLLITLAGTGFALLGVFTIVVFPEFALITRRLRDARLSLLWGVPFYLGSLIFLCWPISVPRLLYPLLDPAGGGAGAILFSIWFIILLFVGVFILIPWTIWSIIMFTEPSTPNRTNFDDGYWPALVESKGDAAKVSIPSPPANS